MKYFSVGNKMSTFSFPEVAENRLNQKSHCQILASSVIQKLSFFDEKADRILKCTDRPDSIRAGDNGLLGTILNAYNYHVPLVLRPDDIWLGIATSFGNYVTNHSEEMRSCLVQHKGKKELVVKVESPFLEYTTEKHWEEFLGLMANEIDKNTNVELADWIVPNFSTTTQNDRIASRIVLMGSVKEFFSYGFELGCGLSKVTLEGSLNDWLALREKVEGLRRFNTRDLTNWCDLLGPVIDQFVQAYQGNVDSDFWQRVCTHKTRGSGGQRSYGGWFLVFSPFDSKGKYLLRPKEQVDKDHVYAFVKDDSFVPCGIDVPVVINDHGTEYQTVFYAGILTSHYDKERNSLSPNVEWAMIIKKPVTYQDLYDSLQESFITNRASERERTDQQILLKFAYHIAIESHFDNGILRSLGNVIPRYYTNRFSYTRDPSTNRYTQTRQKGALFNSNDLVNFYKFLLDREESYLCKLYYGKYMDPDRCDEIIDSFCNDMIEICFTTLKN